MGRTFGHYRIVEEIGAGGMGEVYRAHDERLDRDVALKVLPAASFADPAARARLLREARTASKLNHPHICTIHEVGEADGQAYIAMELVEGQPLSARVAGGPLPVEQALRYGQQVADALAHAHERGIVHRDLKSLNVMITPEGRAKVLDFGLAKEVREEELETVTRSQASLTAEGALAGTLAYMAPEQLRGQPADTRSDVWALGVVLHEMLAGQRPFQGTSGYELSAAILTKPPGTLPSKVPVAVRAVVERCLTKEPGERYQQAGEVRAALEAVASGTVAPWVGLKYTLRRRPALAVAATVVLLLAGAVGLNVGNLRDRLLGLGPAKIESIAVLPLENLSGDPEQDYFAAGMHEALINDLAKLGGFKRVIARTSMMQYQGTDKPLPQIAQELGVDAVLTGAVLREGGRVRVTAQLIHAVTQEHLWADRYERDLREVLSLQNELVASVTRGIRLQLTPQEQARLASARRVNPEAYEAFLRGRSLAHGGSRAQIEQAIEHFERALALDPNNALAYAGLAQTYQMLSSTYLPPLEAMPKARAAALKALELDATLAEARATLAYVKQSFDWDLLGAEEELKRAIDLSPNSAAAHGFYGTLLTAMERHEEAAEHFNRALEVDPFSPQMHVYSFVGYYMRRDYDKAIARCQMAIDKYPTFPWAHAFQAVAYAQKGQYPKGIAAAEAAVEAVDSLMMQAFLAQTYAIAGKKREARQVLAALKEKTRREYVCPYEIGLAYVALGETDTAFEWLERAYLVRADCMMWMKVDPRLDPLRDDPRFTDLLRRVNLPV